MLPIAAFVNNVRFREKLPFAFATSDVTPADELNNRLTWPPIDDEDFAHAIEPNHAGGAKTAEQTAELAIEAVHRLQGTHG
ncbi:hypothetical protein AB2B41_07070 [Marimonas sp. MJW-29]|uniref:Uncharacterized protein n=1 Tax=Sulfitobacter sediminis TaxID=3234186 RepID=A0ABV3RK41_9RHOB